MFQTLFSYPAVLHRHCEGPFAQERATYLETLAARGAAHGTLLRQARYCLCVSKELAKWPRDHHFSPDKLNAMAASWAADRVAMGRASNLKWPQQQFRSVAMEFIESLGRLLPASPRPSCRYDALIDDFLTLQRQRGWLSISTHRCADWQVRRFLSHLDQQGHELQNLHAGHIDAYFQHLAPRWSRVSIATAAKLLRSWLRHCEKRGWVKAGLAEAIIPPRIYRHEGLPLGPTWDQVNRMIAQIKGDNPTQLRDRALLLLLSVYGLRSGEARRLHLEDLDWQKDRISILRSKTFRQDTFPLAPTVGNAIALYLRQGRPKSDSRTVFLTTRAPFRPLSPGGLYHIVRKYLPQEASWAKHLGPHGLRHACARHLLESGLSFKEVGDHLGHQSPDTTRIYAKVNLTSLRHVALEDLGGLS
jgi:integrase/recombinase XerD